MVFGCFCVRLKNDLRTVRPKGGDRPPHKFWEAEKVPETLLVGLGLADCPPIRAGPSATRPRLTGKFTAGDSGHGLGWGLFLKVSGSVGSSFLVAKPYMH